MSKLIATNKGGGTDFEPIPQDTHLAICYQIIDLGTHEEKKFQSEETAPARKVRIVWELPEVRMEIEKDGEKLDLPRAIGKDYKLSMHPKASLRKDLQKWRGREFTKEEEDAFDLEHVLGKACYLNVIHRESKRPDGSTATYANVDGIMKVPSSVQVPDITNPPRILAVQDVIDNGGNFPEWLPEWMQEKIKESEEYRGFMGGSSSTAPAPQDDDELDTPPF